MKFKLPVVISLFLCLPLLLSAQTGRIRGKVKNVLTNELLPGVSVRIQGTPTGTISGINGDYELSDLTPGFYNIEFNYLGYKPKVLFEVQVNNAKATIIDAELDEDSKSLDEVEITAAAFYKPQESPVSLRTIGVSEIKRNPGGNRDISKVIQSLPGVASTVSFRNDIIIRGGAPNENRFYLDGIEVPNINHFATQGASGGPVGLINVDFVREVDFYSAAFPANRGNALSSVFDFKFKDGRNDKMGASLTMGTSDFAATLEGPIGKKTTYMASYRKSYLEYLFRVIGLPFLPEYNDYQFKVKTRFNQKHELSLLGLGAFDDFALNLDANKTEDQRYILSYLPVNKQNNYTVGANYKYYRSKGYTTVVASRNFLKNKAFKYEDNDESRPKILDYTSTETENKFRIENTSRQQQYRINYGLNMETAEYTNSTFNRTPFGVTNFASSLDFLKYGFFGQVSRGFYAERLQLSIGLRSDANNYSSRMSDLSKHLSPRFSASYSVTTNVSLNFNTGLYYQLPAYTVLGYRDNTSRLANKDVLDYISVAQSVFGVEYNTLSNLKFTVEGFYKQYDRYPMMLVSGDTIPLANLGGDFGVVGNDPVAGKTQGRSYGVEFLAQQKLNKGFYGIVALTFVRSEFRDKHERYVPSAWDSRYIVSLTGGKIFKRNWEVGAKLRASGGAPYTPYDVAQSSLKTSYDLNPQGIKDYDLLNTQRLGAFYQLDIRVDKKYNFKKFSLNVFLDVQNVTGFQSKGQSLLVPERDANGNAQTDPGDPSRYQMKFLDNFSGTRLPGIGIIVEL